MRKEGLGGLNREKMLSRVESHFVSNEMLAKLNTLRQRAQSVGWRCCDNLFQCNWELDFWATMCAENESDINKE